MVYKKTSGKPIKGWVIIVHGLGEHCGRHNRLMEMLTEKGFSVIAFDWPGHGKSEGKKGHGTIEDGLSIIHELIEEINDKPFLIGYSLGGLTVIRYAELHPNNVKGAIASAPALAPPQRISPLVARMAKSLGLIVPFLSINNTIKPKDISRNKKAVTCYANDPLVHDRLSLGLARSYLLHMEMAHRDAERIMAPLLILTGTSDVLAPPSGSYKFMQKLNTKDKKLQEFEGAYHEIFEDPEWADKFHETILQWLYEHTKPI